jgi:hypothetical protein
VVIHPIRSIVIPQKKNVQGKLTNDPRESIDLKGIVRAKAIVFSLFGAEISGKSTTKKGILTVKGIIGV